MVNVRDTEKVLTSIRPLSGPKAIVGGYEDVSGHIYVVAAFSDGSEAVLKILRP